MDFSFGLLIGGVAVLVAFFAYTIVFRRHLTRASRETFQSVASELFSEKIQEFLKLASANLGEKKDEIRQNLSEKERRFDGMLQDIREELRHHREHISRIEQERTKSFSDLGGDLKRQIETTERLRGSTEKLGRILADNRLRGQFGERIAADILKMSGLIEGTHYVVNKQQETVSTRPDFTFILPEGHKINMDAKFPLASFAKMVEAEQKGNLEIVEQHKNQFFKDVKAKMREVTSRDYINPQEQTLDWVILFIPNEGVASFIHEQYPELFELALKQKIVFTSPYQLLGLVRIIHQSYENFYYNDRIREILKLISELMNRFETLRERFAKMGDSLERMQKLYSEIQHTSFRLVGGTIEKIDAHRRGVPAEVIEEDSLPGKALPQARPTAARKEKRKEK